MNDRTKQDLLFYIRDMKTQIKYLESKIDKMAEIIHDDKEGLKC